MRKFLLTSILSLIVLAAGVQAAPQLQQGSIVNAASFAVSGAPNAGIAQGSLFTVFGVDVGPATASNVNQFPLPTALGGVSIRITANGQNFDCPMIFAINTQVSAILPSNVPVGTASLVLTYNGQASNAITFPVVSRTAGVFSRSSSGSGQAVIQNYISPSIQPVNAINAAAQPGQIGILWATGLGASLNADDRSAPATGNLLPLDQIAVYVGGVKADVQYAGRSGCCAGVDQVNFVVPNNVEGCFVPVVVSTNGTPSNFTSMAVSKTGSTCDGAFGLSSAQIDTLSSKQSIRIGTVALTRTRTELFGITVNSESGVGAFTEITGAGLLSAGSELGDSELAINSCIAHTFSGNFDGGEAPDAPELLDALKVRGLDAGTAISVSGPGGQRQLSQQANQTGVYFGSLGDPLNPLSSYLAPGSYTLANGAGGADVGAFSFSKNVPSFLSWTNRGAITDVARNQGLTVTWTPGTTGSGLVAISGFSYSIPGKTASTFFCMADPGAGTFTVPAYVLGSMVASNNGGNSPVPAGTLSVGGVLTPAFFDAPGIDLGVFDVTAIDSKSVNYQ